MQFNTSGDNQNSPKMGDIDFINDSIASQKLISDNYNTFAN